MAKKIFKEDDGEVSLLNVAEEIKQMRESTRDKIDLVEKNPTKENVNALVIAVNKDNLLSSNDKKSLIEILKKNFISLLI